MKAPVLLACTALLACSKTDPSAGTAAAPPTATAMAALDNPCAPQVFDALLERYVRGGKVDYGRLKATEPDAEAFDAYVGRVATAMRPS